MKEPVKKLLKLKQNRKYTFVLLWYKKPSLGGFLCSVLDLRVGVKQVFYLAP